MAINFLDHIIRVTRDKTWVSFVNIETKEQSKQWMHTHSPNKPKKFKHCLPARKLKTTVFWDRKGVLIMEFVQQTTIVMSEVYCKTLKKLCRAIQNERHGMLVVLLHGNACPHTRTAACTPELLKHFKWELSDHPSYNPDLTSSVYHLFTHLKNWL
jgi:hypothetical protein